MNSPITFPPPVPALKLARPTEKWAATLAEERRRLQEDQDALREREANLREYEARLRSLQAEIEAGRTAPVPAVTTRSSSAVPFQRPSSRAPFVDDAALQMAWEKLHRAREILEAEQTHLRDDRIGMREIEAALKRREEAVAAREAHLAEREALVVAATSPAMAVAGAPQPDSAVSKFTTAPFKIACAVLRGKR